MLQEYRRYYSEYTSEEYQNTPGQKTGWNNGIKILGKYFNIFEGVSAKTLEYRRIYSEDMFLQSKHL